MSQPVPHVRGGIVAVIALMVVAFTACPAARGGEAGAPAASRPARPNIVLILADDLGYGDIGCYGATKVKTPNLDRLASTGLRFTDGHCTAATCTPSRYSLLTGQYAWRRKGTGILPGDASLIIDPARPTLPSMLRKAGYATGCVGKWHLGLGEGGEGKVDWNGEIKPGPLEIGFDESFIIPATGDRVPCVFIEGHRVVGFDPTDPIAVSYGFKVGDWPTGRDHPELLKLKPSHGHDDTIINGISRIGFQHGGTKALWKDDQIADRLTTRALDFIEQHKAGPFFLYFATHDIHVPRVPGQRFRGTSGCGVRGDVIQELDGSVGQVLAALDRLKLADSTLVIFSSDNGPVVDDGYADGAVRDLTGHTPAGPWKGGKYTIWEGGTRVPLIARWPGKIEPGVSDALVSQIDFPATMVALAGESVPAGAAPDSRNTLPAFLGQDKAGRESLVEQGGGYQVALRKGQWKFIPATARGGRNPGPAGRAGVPQLYDLKADPGETKNVAAQHGEKVAELQALLDKERGDAETESAGPKGSKEGAKE